MNPFTFGNPIRDTAHFYGRKQELRQVVNRLLSSAHESTSIVGERRIGKTSLLNYLSNPAAAESLGLTSDKFCLVYIDFQGLTDITPHRFWQRVLSRIAGSVCDKSLKPPFEALSRLDEIDLFDLEDVFEKSQQKGLTHVLLLDEFEYVTQNPRFTPDFFGGLRALAIHHGVTLIPATQRELVDLCHSEEIKGSPFFNIFANVVLRPFSHAEVVDLLDGSLQASETAFSDEEKQLVIEMSGGIPFLVQMAGYYLYEARLQSLDPALVKRSLVENFNQQAESHFSYLWNHCSENEKITLILLLAMNIRPASKKSAPTMDNLSRLRPRVSRDIASLLKRGIVVESEGSFRLFSPSFGGWITREVQSGVEEDGEAQKLNQWVRSNNHGRLSDLNKVLPHFKKKYWEIVAEALRDFTIEFAAAGAFEFIKVLIH
jgi:AAA+ ATPase superfamily predicted ATPase